MIQSTSLIWAIYILEPNDFLIYYMYYIETLTVLKDLLVNSMPRTPLKPKDFQLFQINMSIWMFYIPWTWSVFVSIFWYVCSLWLIVLKQIHFSSIWFSCLAFLSLQVFSCTVFIMQRPLTNNFLLPIKQVIYEDVLGYRLESMLFDI